MKNNYNFLQTPLKISLRNDATFANYFYADDFPLIGYLKQNIQTKKDTAVFLSSDNGNGKTHLLQACCHYANEFGTAFYFPCQEYLNFSPVIFDDLEKLSLICLDDISALQKQPLWERSLFKLFNNCLLAGTTIIFADKLVPNDLTFDLPDLQSRMLATICLTIRDLSDAEKITVLRTYAHQQGMALTEEVAEFLLRRCDRNLKNLFALLIKLDQASLSAQRKLTIPFVKVVLNI